MTKITGLYFLLGLVFVGAENGAADNMYMWGEGFAFFYKILEGGGGEDCPTSPIRLQRPCYYSKVRVKSNHLFMTYKHTALI